MCIRDRQKSALELLQEQVKKKELKPVDHASIDYLHVRGDMRGKGHARRLIQALIDRHPNLRILDFGKMMRKEIGHLKDYFAEKYKDRIIVIGRVNY